MKVTVVGLSIVFAVLIILMIVLLLFKVIFYKEAKNKVIEKQPENITSPIPAAAVQSDTASDSDELIAVITAAVAASLGTSESKFKIKSYRRIPNKKPVWNKAGINETINSHIT